MCQAESGKVFVKRRLVAGSAEGFVVIIIIVVVIITLIGEGGKSRVDFGLEVGER